MRIFLIAFLAHCSLSHPTVLDSRNNVTYNGLARNGLDVFLNLRYAEDTSGENRFKPPRPHIPTLGSIVNANSYGIACPQPLNSFAPPLSLTNITQTSEDCLNLNIVRPNSTHVASRLPVMVFIHGGGFWTGSNQEIITTPDGLVKQSVENQLPIIHVALNYRLGGKMSASEKSLTDTSKHSVSHNPHR